MTPRDKKLRALCLGSIFWTAWHLCGYRKLSMVLHLGLTIWLQRALDSTEWQRFLCMIPRDYFKTSCLGVAGVVWYLLNNPDNVVLYTMHKHKIAAEKMGEVQAAFESTKMARLFPELAVTAENKATLTWTAGYFTIPRPSGKYGTPSVTCAGIVSGATGGHYDWIIWDDPIKGDSEDASSQLEAAIRKVRKITFLWKQRRATPGFPASNFLVMGTLWEGGFYEKLMAKKNYLRLILGATADDRFQRFVAETGIKLFPKDDPYVTSRVLESNRAHPWAPGHAIFPEFEDDGSLADARVDAEIDYDTQMENIPTDAKKRRFLADDFVEYRMRYKAPGVPAYAEVDGVAFPYSGLFRTLCWDPTGGTSKDCDTAGVTVCGYERANSKIFLLDRWLERADIIVQINRVLDMAVQWDVKLVSPEAAAFQVVLKDLLEEEMKRRIADGRMRRRIRIEPYKRGSKSKGTWILDSLTFYTRNNMFHVLPEHSDVIDHLVDLKIRNGVVLGESPGLADSLAMHKPWWKSRVPRQRPGDIRDEDDGGRIVANMPVKYGLRPSVWQGGIAV